jgi:hypothetical protein
MIGSRLDVYAKNLVLSNNWIELHQQFLKIKVEVIHELPLP